MIPTLVRGAYHQNAEMLAEFYGLQGDFAAALAARPELVREWLDARPKTIRASEEGGIASQSWRTSRLTLRRRRELRELLLAAPSDPDRLATWLRASLPVLSLLDIGDFARPSLRDFDPRSAECAAQIMALREKVFHANYGLAKAAAARGRPDGFDDRLSAACVGLLDAIDRYVPGERSARFAYFATYWIRYQIGRQAQKFNGVVAFPIYQQRMVRKIEQFAGERRAKGLAEATEREVCAALEMGADAYYRHRQRPSVFSLSAPAVAGDPDGDFEHQLCDPAPSPDTEMQHEELAERINRWLKRSFPPATRVMLAYAHDLGPLHEAAFDYLTHLREIARERMRYIPD